MRLGAAWLGKPGQALDPSRNVSHKGFLFLFFKSIGSPISFEKS